MVTFLTVLLILVYLKLLLVASMKPKHSNFSNFELNHRVDKGDKAAQAQLRREAYSASVMSLLRGLSGLLIVAYSLLSIAVFGWVPGSVTAILGVLVYGGLGQLKVFRSLGRSLYHVYEPHLFRFAERFPLLTRIIGVSQTHEALTRLGSRVELEYLVDSSEGILSSDEKKLIIHSLSFSHKLISTVMTPRGHITTINKSEFLGPLTLDELHRTGHSRLPVIDGDIDHVIGILQIQSLLALDIKRSVTAEKAMEPRVFYIREDQTLQHALAAFLRTHHHLFIVVNEYRETVGIVTLDDALEALIGRKIIDEFDSHEDLRTVATRKPSSDLSDLPDNTPKTYEDV